MTLAYWLIFGCGLLAIIYGIYTSYEVLKADAGSERMREIGDAIQEGANAYLNRQYRAISIVGVVIGVLLWWQLGLHVALGYAIGAILSGAAGYIGGCA
jgi:K(+)-stimulated pyrophosphate-energized sodium pump